MDQTTRDKVRDLEEIDSAYRDASTSLYHAFARVDSTLGAGDGRTPLRRAITAIDNLREPIIKELATLHAQAKASEPKKEGFKSL